MSVAFIGQPIVPCDLQCCCRKDDALWPEPDEVGRQELEIKDADAHIAFTCSKLGTMLEIKDSDDPEGLKALYFLVQDLKCLVFSLISLHFKVKPIPN